MGCNFIEELFYGNIAPQELSDDNRKKLLTSAWKKADESGRNPVKASYR